MTGLAFRPWPPPPWSVAVNIGLMQLRGLSGGSVNFGVTAVEGAGGGGGGSSNQQVGIQGDCGVSWINLAVAWSLSGPGAAAGGGGAGTAAAPEAQSAGGPAPAVPARPASQGWSGGHSSASAPATFRFRWDHHGAAAATSAAAKEGRHVRRTAAGAGRSGLAAHSG